MNKLSDNDISTILAYSDRQPRLLNESIKALDGRVNDGTLIIRPDYQRNYIQRYKDASKFIETILIGGVIPEIIFF